MINGHFPLLTKVRRFTLVITRENSSLPRVGEINIWAFFLFFCFSIAIPLRGIEPRMGVAACHRSLVYRLFQFGYKGLVRPKGVEPLKPCF